jgi:lipopolysaccharide export system protein LptC
MQKEVHPALLIVVIVVALLLLGFLFWRSQQPSEKVIDNPNASIGFQGRLQKLQKMQGRPAINPGTSIPSGPSGP